MPNLIGTAPDQVPVNGFLGNMAFQNKEGVVTDLLSTTALTVTGTASFAGTIAAGLGSAAAPSYTFIGDTNTGIFSPAADTIAFSEGGVEAMRITSAGLVGIGTTSPASKLHVESTSGAAGSAVARLTVTGTNGLEVGQEFFSTLVSGSTTALRSGRIYSKFDGSSYVSSRLSFQSMTTSNVLVDTMHLKNGSVGIGTSSPNTKLAVEGSACEISINDTAGTIAGLRFRTSGTTKGVIQADSTSNLRFSSGSTEAMRILSSGNVGIGTSSPSQKLDIGGGGNVVLTGASTGDQSLKVGVSRSGNGYSFIDLQGDTTYDNGLRIIRTNGGANTPSNIEHRGTGALSLITQEAGPITFLTSATERARIDSSGNLLVGKSSLAGEVTTDGAIFYKNASGGGMTAYVTNGGTGSALAVSTQADVGAVIFFRSGTQVGSISVTASATAYNTSSDYRLKDIDGPVANSGAYIDALKPVQGSWKADGSRFIGLLAHEVQEVSETSVATGVKDGEEMQAMDYSAPELIANLIAEIQSLRARVAQLEGN